MWDAEAIKSLQSCRTVETRIDGDSGISLTFRVQKGWRFGLAGRVGGMIRLLATFFYLGTSPRMPGTVGTLGGVPVVMALYQLGALGYMFGALILTLLAIGVSQVFESRYGVSDSPEVVIDEVVGYVVAMTWLPWTWQSFVFAFVLFRLLDIWKPFPIGYIDRNVKGGLGVVVDDVAAGLVVNLVLQIVYTHTHWLGEPLGV